jgi:hypothetical protein
MQDANTCGHACILLQEDNQESCTAISRHLYIYLSGTIVDAPGDVETTEAAEKKKAKAHICSRVADKAQVGVVVLPLHACAVASARVGV